MLSRSRSLPFDGRGAAVVVNVEVNVPAARSKLSAESDRFIGGLDEVERQMILNFWRRVGVRTVGESPFDLVAELLVVSKHSKWMVVVSKVDKNKPLIVLFLSTLCSLVLESERPGLNARKGIAEEELNVMRC